MKEGHRVLAEDFFLKTQAVLESAGICAEVFKNVLWSFVPVKTKAHL